MSDEAEANIDPVTSVAAQALSDLGTAAGLAAAAGIDLSAVPTAFTLPGATIPNTVAYAAAQSMVNGAQALIGNGIADAEAQLVPTGTPILLGPGAAVAGSTALGRATVIAGQLGSLTAAKGYLGRTATNLANARS